MRQISQHVWKSALSWWSGKRALRRVLRGTQSYSVVSACVEMLEPREVPSATPVFRVPANPDPLRSLGPQSTLVVRVDFTDEVLEGVYSNFSDSDVRDAYSEVNNFYTRQSFGKLTFPENRLTIVPDNIELPFTSADLEGSSNGPDRIVKAVEKKLRGLGYNLKDYLHLTIIHPYLEGKKFDYSGLGLMPGNRLLLNANINAEVWAHELGHNAGAPHAGIFDPKDPLAAVADPKLMKFVEAPTRLDLMDADGLVDISNNGDMFALRKAQFGWLDLGTNVVNVTQSGTFRLSATNDGTEQDDRVYALRIRRNATQEYWLEYRGGSGIMVTLHNYGGDKKLGLLDMTPNSNPTGVDEDFMDSPLFTGRPFDDFGAKIHIMPVEAFPGDGIDVLVTVGDVPDNHAPTATMTVYDYLGGTPVEDATVLPYQSLAFTATGQDLDGDGTHVLWEIGDRYSVWDRTTVIHSWDRPGSYPVRLTVNDGRGGISHYVKMITVSDSPLTSSIVLAHQPEFDRRPNQVTLGEQFGADVASDGRQRSVVVWSDQNAGTVLAQRFEGTQPSGPEITVGRSVSSVVKPSVAMAQNGDFVVVWQGSDSQAGTTGIFGQKFDAIGQVLGDQFEVTSDSGDIFHLPNVAMDPVAGRFVVSWNRALRDYSRYENHYTAEYRLFDADGHAVAESRAMTNTQTTASTAVAMNSAGEVVIGWGERGSERVNVFAQRLHADGTLNGTPLPVRDTRSTNRLKIEAAFAPDGGFAFVVGSVSEYDSEVTEAILSIFQADGTRLAKVSVSDFPFGRETSPALAIDGDGHPIVTWHKDGFVVARIFSREGVGLSDRTYASYFASPTTTSVAVLGDSASLVVVSQSQFPGQDNFDPFLRFFAVSTPIITEPDFVSTPINKAVSVFVSGNDTNPLPGPMTLSLPVTPTFGTVSINQNRTPADLADDLVVFTPRVGFQGMEEIVYQVTNSLGVSAYGTLRVHVGEPDPSASGNPVFALADSFSTKEDVVLKAAGIGVLKNDSRVNVDKLTAELVSGTSHGTLTFKPNGSFTYKPAANFSGTDSFIYRVSNGQNQSRPATVTLRVDPVADKPTFTIPKTLSGMVGSEIDFPLKAELIDTDGSETIAVKLSGLPATATLNRGTKLSDGTWQLTSNDFKGLKVQVPALGTFTLKMTCISTESLSGTMATSTASLRLQVT